MRRRRMIGVAAGWLFVAGLVQTADAQCEWVLLNQSFGQAEPAGWTRWRVPWGTNSQEWAIADGTGRLSLPAGASGSFGWYQVQIVPASMWTGVYGAWRGNIGSAGWAEVMFFSVPVGTDAATIATRIDTGNAADIAYKKDSWGMNPPTTWDWQDASLSPHPSGNSGYIHSWGGWVVLAVKLGGFNTEATYVEFDWVSDTNSIPDLCSGSESCALASITPNRGVSGTVQSVNLEGTDFNRWGSGMTVGGPQGTEVRLRRADRADIVASDVVVVSDTRITCTFDLTGAAEGPWEVKVFNAPSGCVEAESFAIVTGAPMVRTFAIKGGAATTASRTVTLNNTCWRYPSEYMASESPGFDGATWQSYSYSPSFELSAGNGIKTVYVKTRNVAGESAVVSDTIELVDLTSLVVNSFAINFGAATTAWRGVTLNSACSGPPDEYMASESPGFDSATWEPYSSAAVFVLSPGSGSKTVYFKVRNGLGESSPASDMILLSPGSESGRIVGEGTVPPPDTDFVAVAAGQAHSLGLKADGSIVAWGNNLYGQCDVPAPNSGFVAVAAGGDSNPLTDAAHSLGLKADGSILAWGDNGDGQCNVPAPNSGFVAVAAGVHYSLGLKADGSIVAWGNNLYGQCDVPAPNSGFVETAAGIHHSLGLKADGSIWAWGENGSGQCDVPAPNSGFVGVAPGGWHSLGMRANGSVVSWGGGPCDEFVFPEPGYTAVEGEKFGRLDFHVLGLRADGESACSRTYCAWRIAAPRPGGPGLRAISVGRDHALAIQVRPVLNSLTINNGDDATMSPTVTLDNNCWGAQDYMASEAADFAGATWQPYSQFPSFQLSSGNGTKTVYFKTRNAAGESSTMSDTITLAVPAPTVAAITPNQGANTGPVAITNLAGTGFQSGATVKLTKPGLPDIVAGASVNVVSPTQITCTFDLTGAYLGARDVVVTNPDSQIGTLADGFTVVAPCVPTAELVGQWGGVTDGVAVAGNRAYIGAGGRLVVLDISSPASPVILGQTDVLPGVTDTYTGIVKQVAVRGDYAYVAADDSGLHIIDISNPAAPVRVGGYDTSGYARGVACMSVPQGGTDHVYALVADGTAGLEVIEVTDPASPSLVGGYNTSGLAWGVAVAGSYAYVADGGAGLQVIDVSSPAAPSWVGGYNTSGSVYGVAVSGSYAYVADGPAGLQVIDVSSPAAPTRVGGYDTSGTAYGVSVSGSYAYVADGTTGLQVINVSNPAAPTRVGGLPTNDARGVSVSGAYAYVAAHTNGLKIIEVSSPSTPRGVGEYQPGGSVSGVAISGRYAYLADDQAGLQVIDISNPASPWRVGGYNMMGFGTAVAVSGGYAYMAAYSAGLQVIDVSNPAAPSLVGSYDTSGLAWGVAVAGSYAYVADGGAGLQVIDVFNPAAPLLMGSYDTSGGAGDVAIYGSYAYVADGSAGLQVIDVSNPAAPSLMGSYGTSGNTGDVAVSGNYACVAEDTAGLQVIDISNPAAPTGVGTYDTNGNAGGVAISGPYVYVADGNAGLAILQFCATLPGSPWGPSPADGAADVPLETDPDWADAGGATSYDIYFGAGSLPGTPAGNTASSNWPLPRLSQSTTYYWKVVAKNAAGEASGPVWTFTTALVCPPVPGDFNGDCDVDADDWEAFELCASGPGVAYTGDCAWADLDPDADVDQVDFGIFQRCYSGENVPASPACAN